MSDTRELYRQDMVATMDRAHMGEAEILTMEALTYRKVNAHALAGKVLENAAVLDLGCADRFLEAPIRARRAAYVGIDYDRIDFERETLPLGSESIDTAIALAVIEHIRDPGNLLGEVMRVLRPGGTVYLSMPNFRYDFRAFYDDPTHVHPYTPAAIETLLTLHGFVGVETFPGLRCKPSWMYRGPLRFWRARWLLPFRGDAKWAPRFLKGQARSIFAVGRKPI